MIAIPAKWKLRKFFTLKETVLSATSIFIVLLQLLTSNHYWSRILNHIVNNMYSIVPGWTNKQLHHVFAIIEPGTWYQYWRFILVLAHMSLILRLLNLNSSSNFWFKNHRCQCNTLLEASYHLDMWCTKIGPSNIFLIFVTLLRPALSDTWTNQTHTFQV